MARLASIGTRSVHQPFTLAIWNQLKQSTDWDYVPGADLASLTAGNTLNITSRHHKVTIVGGTIDNISDAAGATAGQIVELYCTGANTFRNLGGGTGNIRTIAGGDITGLAAQVVSFVYDGANWRELVPTDAAILSSTAAQIFSGPLSTGPSNGSFSGGQTPGVFVSTAGQIVAFNSAAFTVLNSGLTTDTVARFSVSYQGTLTFGGGGASAQDATFKRLAAGVLGDTATALSTGPSSNAVGGAAAGVFVEASGRVLATRAANSSPTFGSSITGDSFWRFQVDTNGLVSWGSGAVAADTTLARASAGLLNVGNKTVEAYLSTSAGAGTWTPSLANGLVQRYSMTGAGTLTVASPGAPPANSSGILILIVHNASGGTITLSWNAIYNQSQAAPANGAGICTGWAYNPATSKWTLLWSTAE